uniref:Small proline rich n=1 Tax=Echinococcus granulosus TaxID=6210 RepID=A0A068X2A9_ECHGR|nr:Small proline rich [Echinococcus granulosus]
MADSGKDPCQNSSVGSQTAYPKLSEDGKSCSQQSQNPSRACQSKDACPQSTGQSQPPQAIGNVSSCSVKLVCCQRKQRHSQQKCQEESATKRCSTPTQTCCSNAPPLQNCCPTLKCQFSKPTCTKPPSSPCCPSPCPPPPPSQACCPKQPPVCPPPNCPPPSCPAPSCPPPSCPPPVCPPPQKPSCCPPRMLTCQMCPPKTALPSCCPKIRSAPNSQSCCPPPMPPCCPKPSCLIGCPTCPPPSNCCQPSQPPSHNLLASAIRPKPPCCQNPRPKCCPDAPPAPPICYIRSISCSPPVNSCRGCAVSPSPTCCRPTMTRSTSLCGDSGGSKNCQSTPCPGGPYCPKRPPCPRPNC